MPHDKEDEYTLKYLSWKKLQLSGAKLKASSKTSALFSGFAMVAMVELQLEENMSESLLIAFAIVTTLLVSIHVLALMISTCILPNILTISYLHNINLVHESPHERLHWYIEIAWVSSTVLGLFLFLLEIGILCAVKFYKYSPNSKPLTKHHPTMTTAPIWATIAVLIPVLIILITFAVHFYKTLLLLKCQGTFGDLNKVELIQKRMQYTDRENKYQNNSSLKSSIDIV